jgi:hypothetical protein
MYLISSWQMRSRERVGEGEGGMADGGVGDDDGRGCGTCRGEES